MPSHSNDCSICLDSLHTEARIGATVPCGHVFHLHCMEQWRREDTARCPNCNVRTTHLQPLFVDMKAPTNNQTSIVTHHSSRVSSEAYASSYEFDHDDDETIISAEAIHADGGSGFARASELSRKYGCFVYRVLSKTAIRRFPSVEDKYRLVATKDSEPTYFKENDLVSVDCIQHATEEKDDSGPYLRLSDHSGWIFENKKGQRVLERLPVNDGLWSFHIENFPIGIAIRRQPIDRQEWIDQPARILRPTQKVTCDKSVRDPLEGTCFYRIQGTNGWLFDKRGAKCMLIPAEKVKKTFRIYKALAPVAIRSTPDVCEESKMPISVKEGELVAVDLVRESPYANSPNGPFLRLADSSGWLFETKHSEPMMEQVSFETGEWSCRILTPTLLRRQPIARRDFILEPQMQVPSTSSSNCDDVLRQCDYRVRNGNITFYHIKGLDWWIPDRLKDKIILRASRVSFDGAHLVERSWRPSHVRDWARQISGLTEIGHWPDIKMMSFQTSTFRDRINVYYSTRTVATVLDHTAEGNTDCEHFHRNCSPSELLQIFRNPRVNIGGGYQVQRRHRRRTISGSSMDADPLSEEAIARESMRCLDKQLATIQRKKSAVLSHIHTFDKREKTDSNVSNCSFKLFQQKIAEKKEAEEEAARRRNEQAKKKRAREARGDTTTCWMYKTDEISLDGTSQLIAMGGHATLQLSEDYGWSYTSGLASGLYKLLHTRALSHPRPQYVALGSEGRFFVIFSNGRCRWSGNLPDRFSEIIRENNSADFVAFGEFWDSYIVCARGKLYWSNIPGALQRVLNNSTAKSAHSVSLGPSGEYFVAWKDGSFKGGGWDNNLNSTMCRLKREGRHVRDVKFGDGNTYIIRYSSYSGGF